MMKFITAIAAFSLTFILSVALVGFPKTDYDAQVYELRSNIQTQQNIQYLLNQDIRNGVARDRKIYEKGFSYDSKDVSPEYADVINEYVDNSTSLDDTQLPADFQLAWQSHMRAWHEHASFLNRTKSFCKMRKLTGEDFSDIFNRQDREITNTWRRVISVAGKYGATVPYQYY